MKTLYHYVHCPYCIRIRMACSYLKIDYKSVVLPYDDEKTPLELTDQKMLPILVKEDQSVLNESLDIIEYLDQEGSLKWDRESTLELESELNKVGTVAHNLAMPQWIYTQEFNDQSRDYFVKKKSQKRGPFKQLYQRKEEFFSQVSELLEVFEEARIRPKQSVREQNSIELDDILIASHFWGLFVVPEFQFSEIMYNYLMRVKKLTHFNYHEDFWRD